MSEAVRAQPVVPTPEAERRCERARSPIAATGQIRLVELLSALSYALDMTEGQPPGHCVRCCWIGTHIGRQIGLPEAELSTLYYTLLLKDLGCSSNAARICELYAADDLTFKHDFKQMGDSLPQVLRFVLTHTGLQSGLAERFQAILNIMQNGGEITRELIETRCQRGAEIARQMRFSEAVAEGIRDLDEHWDGRGKPLGLKGEDISIYARVALLAQVIDVFHQAAGVEQACREAERRSGRWFDPALVAAFNEAARAPGFWSTLGSDSLHESVFALDPAQRTDLVDDEYLDDIAVAFAGVIDAKSPYTHGHSERVALFTDLIGKELGHSGEKRRWLKRAALLHDIGKLGVSNAILDKPGKLDDEQWVEMRNHTLYGEAILSRIDAFSGMAEIAAGHHERLDGEGYPRRLTADQLSPDTRIVSVADVFDALTAERPYRAALPVREAFAIMEKDVEAAFDPVPYGALKNAMARLM